MAELDREYWERRFRTPDYLFGTEPNSFLKSQAHRLKVGQTALAIADGEGRNGVWLAERGLHAHAVDISPAALAKARALAERRGVSLRNYTRPMLEAAIANLTELKIHEHDSVVNEGTAHVGMSALVDLVGVK